MDLTAKEREAVNQLVNICVNVLAYFELDRFKSKREIVYLANLREIAVCEKLLAETKRDLYSVLLEHPNCSL
jgi:hypothetical protein